MAASLVAPRLGTGVVTGEGVAPHAAQRHHSSAVCIGTRSGNCDPIAAPEGSGPTFASVAPCRPGSASKRTPPVLGEFDSYVPEVVGPDDIRRRGVPVNAPVYVEPYHFMASVQAFSGGGFEVTAKLVDAQKIAERRCLAAPARRRGLVDADSERHRANVLRARQRAKRRVRHVCKEMGADRLLTLTTRELRNSPEEMLAKWQRWLLLVERASGGRRFHYVAVLEPHPSNPDHFHLHVAVAVFLSVDVLRRCWWQVCGGRGMGNVHIKRLGGAEMENRVSRVASYISKYLTKDCLIRFNKKSYWSSRVNLPEVRRYWLRARTMDEVLRELVERFGVRFERAWLSDDQSTFWAAMPPGEDYGTPF